MDNMVDIEVIIDDTCVDPKIKIHAKEKNRQVENIIYAIENVTENDYPRIAAQGDEGLEFVAQKDIIRAFTEGRKLFIETDDGRYVVKKTLYVLEEELNPARFIRISQSEIINILKVKRFDISISGTIGVEFENGTKSWASRSCVKAVKKLIKS